ncbi:hypothetical protein BDW68DRAFT_43541, partial [Aspergillus falconensis]
MPPRKGQSRTLPNMSGGGGERRQRTRRSLPVAPADPQTEPETRERTGARVEVEPKEVQIQKYKEWKRNGSPHDTICRVCLQNASIGPGPLHHCRTCRVAFHWVCKPDGIVGAAGEGFYCPICVERAWHLALPELPHSSSPDYATPERSEGGASAAVPRAVSNPGSTNGLEPPQAPFIPQPPQEPSENVPLRNSSERTPHPPALNTRPTSLQHNEDDDPGIEAPRPKRQRTSRFVTLSSDVDASLGVIYRELESVASLKLQIEELQNRDRQSAQMIKLRDNSIAILRRDLEKYRADDSELARLRENAARYDEVKKEVDELKRKNEMLEAELRKSREDAATAQGLVDNWKGKLAQLLNA